MDIVDAINELTCRCEPDRTTCVRCRAAGTIISINAELTRLRSDNERMREALLLKVQQDNACRGRFGGWMRSSRPIDAPPCGPQGGKWDSQQCGCALEARSALSKGQMQQAVNEVVAATPKGDPHG